MATRTSATSGTMVQTLPRQNVVELTSSVDSKLAAVAVYSHRAEVTRTFSTTLAQGQNQIGISGLPTLHIEDSLRVEGTGIGTIQNVTISAMSAPRLGKTNDRPSEESEEMKRLRLRKLELRQAIERNDQSKDTLKNYMDSLVTPGEIIPFSKLVDTTREYDISVEDLQRKRNTLAGELEEITKALSDKKFALSNARKTNFDRNLANKATIQIIAEVEGEIELSLIYAVSNVSWSPRYSIRVDTHSQDKAVALVYKANITQMSGEDWPEAPLTLETATPSFDKTLPTLNAWAIGVSRIASTVISSMVPSVTHPRLPPPSPDHEARGRSRSRSRSRSPRRWGPEPIVPGPQVIVQPPFSQPPVTLPTVPQPPFPLPPIIIQPAIPQTAIPQPPIMIQRPIMSPPPTMLPPPTMPLPTIQTPTVHGHPPIGQPPAPLPQIRRPLSRSSSRSPSLSPPPIVQVVPHQVTTAANFDSDVTATFVVPDLTTIPSDGEQHTVTIADLELDAKLRWVSIPKKDPKTYLSARVHNASEYALLRGPANVYVDGSFIARSSVPAVNPEEKFELSLGIDPAIRITYHPLSKKLSQSGIVSKSKVYNFTRRITVHNTKASTVENVKIIDQIPVSEDSTVIVKLLRPNLPLPASSQTASGDIAKSVKVAPGVTAQWDRPDQGDDSVETASTVSESSLPEPVDLAALGKDGMISWFCSIPPQGKVNLTLQWEVSASVSTTIVGL